MNIDYYPHALEQLAQRELEKQVVEEALLKPDEIVEAKFGRKAVHKHAGKKVLRVIFEEKNNVYMVVTVYYLKANRVKGLK